MFYVVFLFEWVKLVEVKIDSLWVKDQVYVEVIGLWREWKVVEINGKGGLGEIGFGLVYEVIVVEVEVVIFML